MLKANSGFNQKKDNIKYTLGGLSYINCIYEPQNFYFEMLVYHEYFDLFLFRLHTSHIFKIRFYAEGQQFYIY